MADVTRIGSLNVSARKQLSARYMISQQTGNTVYRVDIHKNSIIMAVFVGTILNCINQGPDLMAVSHQAGYDSY